MTTAAVDETVTAAEPGPSRRRRRVPVRYVAFGVLALAAIGVLGWLLSWWSPVPVRAVTVAGAEPGKEAEILAAAGIEAGTPIRELDAAAITERVAALPGIERANLELARPWTVVVDVVERFPFAVVAAGVPAATASPTATPSPTPDPSGAPPVEGPPEVTSWTVIDSAGVPIRETSDRPVKLPQVEPADQPGPALVALGALSPEVREKVKKAVVDGAGAVTLTLRSGTTVSWGQPGEDDAKAQAVAVLLQYQPSGINVAVPSRPALEGELKLPKQNQPDPDETTLP